MKNKGVTSPPSNPQPSVTTVKKSFQSQLQFLAPPSLKQFRIGLTIPQKCGDLAPAHESA